MKRIALMLCLFGTFAAGIATAGTPNILLILTDDHGWSQLSELMDPAQPESKSDYLETPNINRLITGGMRFTNGYSPAPLCTPTRRSVRRRRHPSGRHRRSRRSRGHGRACLAAVAKPGMISTTRSSHLAARRFRWYAAR